MKQLFTLLALSLVFVVNAATGDTTKIQAHDNSHWTWYGNYDAKTFFPTTNKTYEKVLMEFTIGCPSTGCSAWDYLSKVSARLKTGEQDTTQNRDTLGNLTIDTFDLYYEVELARFVTPYAGDFDNTWERTYTFDVSDFQSILKDSVIIRAFYDGWQDGWIVSTKFLFIEGTPSRDVLGFENLWNGKFDYGHTNNPIADNVQPMTVNVKSGAKQAKLRVTTTGHRFGGAENCAEFCIKTHEFAINGTKQYDQYLWDTRCGMNAEYPQAGTWLYDRAGWCPGAPVDVYEYDLSNYVSGSTITVDYQFDDYTWDNVGTPPGPLYYIASAVVFYGVNNFQNDAELERIISPSKAFESNRYNPICGNPVVVIKNNGNNALTSATIMFGIEGSTSVSYDWTGNLAYLEHDTIELKVTGPPTNLWNGTKENSTFFAEISSVNGTTDEYSNNNRKESKVELPPTYPEAFYLTFKTNSAPEETTYKIYDRGGNVIYQNPENMESRETYDQIINLEPGCYLLDVQDSGEDGADFWANSDGKGKLELSSNLSDPDLHEFDLDFGTALYHHFMVGYTLDIEEDLEEGIFIGPNPAKEMLYIHQADFDRANVTVSIYNVLGQEILSTPNLMLGNERYMLSLENIDEAMIFVEVFVEGKKYQKTILLNK